MRIRIIAACALLAGAFAAAQLRTIDTTNPPVVGDIAAPAPVATELRRACYDCHSNETRWPWYADVAPVSWLVAHDVSKGRRELNFSEWSQYYPATRRRKLRSCLREVENGAMPLRSYRMMHREARLSDSERSALLTWIQGQLDSPAQ